MHHFKVSYHPWTNQLSRGGYTNLSWSQEGKQLDRHLVFQLSGTTLYTWQQFLMQANYMMRFVWGFYCP